MMVVPFVSELISLSVGVAVLVGGGHAVVVSLGVFAGISSRSLLTRSLRAINLHSLQRPVISCGFNSRSPQIVQRVGMPVAWTPPFSLAP